MEQPTPPPNPEDAVGRTGPPADEEEARVSGAAAIFGPTINAIVSPSRCFEVLDARPLLSLWIVLWVAVVSLGLGLWNLPISRQAFAAMTRYQLEQGSSEITPEMVERMRGSTEMMATVTTWASPLLILVMLGIIAGVVWLLASILGKSGRFSRAFAVTGAAAVVHPMLAGAYASVILHLDPPVIRRPQDMVAMQPTVGLDMFFQRGDLPAWLAAVLARVDLFNIWWIFLVATGASVLLKMSKGQGYTLAIIIWLISTGIAAGGAALQAMAG